MPKTRNVLLLFSKLPEVGLVKTRLSILKDGVFCAEDACKLYECMLLDVCEISIRALGSLNEKDPKGTHELVVSTAPKDNLGPMESLVNSMVHERFPRAKDDSCFPTISFICDQGRSFDAHYNDAFEQVWQMGADSILSMGADMPALREQDVICGFSQLRKIQDGLANDGSTRGIVLFPDQEMGVSVIGWTKDTGFSHDGVFYNQEGLTVLPAYIGKAKELGVPAYMLPPIPDVDTMMDLVHNSTLIAANAYCSEFEGTSYAWRTEKMLDELGYSDIRVMPNGLLDPRSHIDK